MLAYARCTIFNCARTYYKISSQHSRYNLRFKLLACPSSFIFANEQTSPKICSFSQIYNFQWIGRKADFSGRIMPKMRKFKCSNLQIELCR